MDRRTLTVLAGLVGVILVIVIFAGGGGLNAATRALVETELMNFEEARGDFRTNRKEAEELLDANAELFRKHDRARVYKKRLEEAASRLGEAESHVDTAQTLTAEDDDKKRVEIEQALENVRAARVFTLSEAGDILDAVRQRIDLRDNLPANLKRMEEAYQEIRAADLSRTQEIVSQAIRDWPLKKEDLEGRLRTISDLVGTSERAFNQARSAGEANPSDIDYDVILEASRVLEQNRTNVPSSIRNIAGLADQLYWSWDKLLVDMEIREGEIVEFFHCYKLIKTRILQTGTEDGKAETSEESSWVSVDKATYDAMEKNLGMVLEHKPGGKYDHEVTKGVQPPGYAYIASPEKKRNHYGYWSSGPGGSFWTFYGQYALMSHLFYGRNAYQPISVGGYRDYDTARRSGRTYYGRDRQGKQVYGTSGRKTQTRYASSRYQRSGGYKNSKYKQSGGSYRGSRYARASSSRRSSYSSRSRSRSRFGGGK